MRKLMLLCFVLLAGCAERAQDGTADTNDMAADTGTMANTTSQTTTDAGTASVQTWQCAELRFTSRITDQTASIELPDRTIELPLSSAGSGNRYTDGMSTFWVSGGRASIELPEGSHYDCEPAPPVDGTPADTLQP